MARRERQLTPAEDRFCDEYLIDDNGVRAYRVAYPEASYTSAKSNARRLLTKAYIKREVQARRDARRKRIRLRADAALKEAARLAFSDPLYLFEDDGVTPRNMRDIPPDTRRAIAEVKVRREKIETKTRGHKTVTVTHDVISYKLWPKPKGLDKVFAHLGLAQEITPLDALLAALPPALAEQVRQALAGPVHPGPDQEGPGG